MIFSDIAYMVFYEDYDGYCQSNLKCFIKSIDWTFKFPEGGVGAGLEENVPIDKSNYIRLFFDIL